MVVYVENSPPTTASFSLLYFQCYRHEIGLPFNQKAVKLFAGGPTAPKSSRQKPGKFGRIDLQHKVRERESQRSGMKRFCFFFFFFPLGPHSSALSHPFFGEGKPLQVAADFVLFFFPRCPSPLR